jgi:hypothetical protein
MRLITAHRILIAAGIGFFVLYAALQGRQYAATGSTAALLQALAALAIAVGFHVYYRSLRGWGRR